MRIKDNFSTTFETLSHHLHVCAGDTGSSGDCKVRKGATVLTSRNPVAIVSEVAIVSWGGLGRKQPK